MTALPRGVRRYQSAAMIGDACRGQLPVVPVWLKSSLRPVTVKTADIKQTALCCMAITDSI